LAPSSSFGACCEIHERTSLKITFRFISPAIVAPDQVDIKVPQDDTGNFRRGLMLIAKIIQNLANNIFFGKEAHLTVLNEYLRENIVTVTRYLSELNVRDVQFFAETPC
jgi:hypothetical protein